MILTTKQAMQALIDGKKIIYFNSVNRNSYEWLAANGQLVNSHGTTGFSTNGYSIYFPPKPKPKMKEVWQWRGKANKASEWRLNPNLHTEDEERSGTYYRYEKHDGPFLVEVSS